MEWVTWINTGVGIIGIVDFLEVTYIHKHLLIFIILAIID